MVFGGDFRQILPVIPRGSRSDIVNATINSSYLWNHCHVLTLLKNMRLEGNIDATDREETSAFAQWILDIGDGIVRQQNDGYGSIEIPKDLLITEYNDPLYAIVNSTFPNLSHHHTNPEYFQSTTILASTNETVQQVNDYILSLILGDYNIPHLILIIYQFGLYVILMKDSAGLVIKSIQYFLSIMIF